MAFASDTVWDNNALGSVGFPPIRTSWLVSSVAVLGLGVALAGWSLATVAAVHKIETSLSSTPALLPESAFAPGAVALFDPTHRIEHVGDKLRQRLAYRNPPAARAIERADDGVSTLRTRGKSGRIAAAAPSRQTASNMPLAERFGETASEAMSTAHRHGSDFIRSRLAAAGSVKSSRMALADAAALSTERASPAKESLKLPKQVALVPEVPANARFAHEVASAIPALLPKTPSAERFGSGGNDSEKPSRIALAVIDAELGNGAEALSPPLPSAPPARSVALPSDAADDTRASDGNPLSDAMPDNVPIPTRRPAWQAPAETAPPAPQQRQMAQPTPQHSRPASPVMAYAKPDDSENDSPLSGLGRLFERKQRLPGLGSGVAVYDIRNAVVYMPDGERLEAHSGLGSMVDKPRYVEEKGRGPTPPNTYNLVLRERRFHGVEAIRLLPVDGRNKYGRDGLLAHTYMLRGGLAESNGCVVFKDYKRFLAAFKRGNVTRLVVVPDLSHVSPTTLASAARGA